MKKRGTYSMGGGGGLNQERPLLKIQETEASTIFLCLFGTGVYLKIYGIGIKINLKFKHEVHEK